MQGNNSQPASSWPHGLPAVAVLAAALLGSFPVPAPAADRSDAPGSLRRITVLETNNFRLQRGVRSLVLPESGDVPAYAALRARVLPKLAVPVESEFDLMRALTDVVHRSFRHDPFGDATPDMTSLDILRAGEAGKRFSCVEYAQVLTDVLLAQGLPARSMSLQSPQVAYGQLASGHVLTEVWSNQFDKWVLLDAQWGVYADHDGIPLNAYELFRAEGLGKWKAVRFRPVRADGMAAKEVARLDREYRAFIERYLGYVSAQLLADDEGVQVLLKMAGAEWPLTFQGLPGQTHIFARTPADLYFEINHVSLVMEFRAESQPVRREELVHGTPQEYQQRMASFAAVPDFKVTPHHNMPWFGHYEYAVDDDAWRRLPTAAFRWNLKEGENRLRVRAVNQAGRAGPETRMRIRYAP